MDKIEARKELGCNDDKECIIFGGAFSNERKNYMFLRSVVAAKR